MSNNVIWGADRKIPFNLSLFFSMLGLAFLLLNFLGIPAIGIASFPCGFIALMLAWEAKSATFRSMSMILIVLSIFVMQSFFIAWRVVAHFEALSLVRYDAPENVFPIRREGYIYDIFRVSEEQIFYVYFAKKECEECEAFNLALGNIVNEDFPTVFYYDIEAMPDEEAEDAMNRLNIDRVPYLIKLEKGSVVDSVTVADEDALKQFFED